jgi:hypothetical protein
MTLLERPMQLFQHNACLWCDVQACNLYRISTFS